jgi:hypothetical protein
MLTPVVAAGRIISIIVLVKGIIALNTDRKLIVGLAFVRIGRFING